MEQRRRQRIESLKNKILSEPRYASIEQAKIITDSYRQHPNQSRVLQRAFALKAALEQIHIRVEPGELIVGNRTAGVRYGVVFPESGSSWVDQEFETLPTRPQDQFQVKKEDILYFREEIKPFWEGKSLEDVLKKTYGKEINEISKIVKINQKDHAQGHICPDCRRWLQKGPKGLWEEAKEKRKTAFGQQKEFYESIMLVMEGTIHFMLRYALKIRSLKENQIEGQKKKMELIAKNCENLAKRPAVSFHEALQSLWFLFVILHMESNASSFSPGRLDLILEPYYKRDLEKETLTSSQALELIECLWLKFNEIVYMRNANSAKYFAGFPIGFNIAIGGQDREGNNVENDLSYLFLKAQEELDRKSVV